MKKTLTLCIILLSLSACSDNPNNGTTSTEDSNPTLSSISISTLGITGIAIADNKTGLASFNNPADDEIIVEDSNNDLKILLPGGYKVNDYDIGQKYQSEAQTTLVLNGDFFGIKKSNGDALDCILIALTIGTATGNPKCIQEKDANYDTLAHVCVAPELVSATAGYTSAGNFTIGKYYQIKTIGTTNFVLIGASANTVGLKFKAIGVGQGTGTAGETTAGDQEKVYFALNKISGGFAIKRWDGINTIEVVKNSETGIINKIYCDDVLMAASGTKNSKGVTFYGNPIYGWHFSEIFPVGIPLHFFNTILYTKVDHIYQPGRFYNFHISLKAGTATTYSVDYSLDCDLPSSFKNIFPGSEYGYWISSTGGKLCSIKPKTGDPSLNDYAITNATITWQLGSSYMDTMFLYGSNSGTPHLEKVDMTSGAISGSNTLSTYNLTSISNMALYQNGIKITGVSSIDGSTINVFFNTNTNSVEANPTHTTTLKAHERL